MNRIHFVFFLFFLKRNDLQSDIWKSMFWKHNVFFFPSCFPRWLCPLRSFLMTADVYCTPHVPSGGRRTWWDARIFAFYQVNSRVFCYRLRWDCCYISSLGPSSFYTVKACWSVLSRRSMSVSKHWKEIKHWFHRTAVASLLFVLVCQSQRCKYIFFMIVEWFMLKMF